MRLLKNISGIWLILMSFTVRAQTVAPLPSSYSPSVPINLVRSWDPRIAIKDTSLVMADSLPAEVLQTTQYIDGLGRLFETVTRKISPSGKDQVAPVVYDAFSRTPFNYLPYVSTSSDGNFKSNAYVEQQSFMAAQYPGELVYYSKTVFEQSDLSRPLQTMPPGNNWAGSGRGVSTAYEVNSGSSEVVWWTVNITGTSLPTKAGFYSIGQLEREITTDEQGKRSVEYKDKEGRTLLKKIEDSTGADITVHTGWLCTYYIYDDLNNLCFVVPPKAVSLLTANSWALNNSIVNELCFRYQYDAKNRMIIKKIPGAGEFWTVYDARDRVAMTQDSLLRSQHKWEFTRYDALNRPDSTGFITDGSNYNNLAYHQGLANISTSYPNLSLYTTELTTQTWYDDYSWVSSTGASLSSSLLPVPSSNLITAYNVSPSYAQAVSAASITKGQITGSMSKVIGKTQALYSVQFYDDRSRAIQTQSLNYSGGIDTTTTQYNFSGIPLRTLLGHKKAGNTVQSHSVLTKLSYDPALRLKSIYKNIDAAGSDQLVDSVQYDELGQPRSKYLGNLADSILYEFNIRGWLTGINKRYVGGGKTNWFGQELNYDGATSITGASYSPWYNGNISGLTWKAASDSVKRKYDFSYDNENRLTAANFTQNTGSGWANNFIDYTVNVLKYDPNGSIMSMTQRGFKLGGSVDIDSLQYNYSTSSNKLRSVVDMANDSSSLLGDFHYKGVKADSDYVYDGNGNLIVDNNKGIDNISYNYLNLPQSIHIKGKGNIVYTYDASGHKLSKLVQDSLSHHATTTLYISGLIYQQTDTISNPTGGIDTLQFINTEEGRARWANHNYMNGTAGYKWEYDFFEKDHLGNTRVVLTQQRDTSLYLASMEGAYRAKENSLFYNIPQTAYSRLIAGYPVDTTTTNPNDSVIMLNGNAGRIQGPAIILKVMAGDAVDLGVRSYYTSQSGTSTNPSITDALNALANGILGVTGGAKGTIGQLNTTGSPLYAALNSFITNKDPNPTGKPKAYLNYLFLDNQFKYDSIQSGAIPVGNIAAGTLGTLAQSGLIVQKSGYLYVYVSNETVNWPVFFDNLSIKLRSGPLAEESHYYPYGLTMAGISDKALRGSYLENKYRYNQGSELQNKEFSDGSGIEMYVTELRDLDPQLGRWWQVDPKTDISYESVTPYGAMNNNPIRFNDPNGDEGESATVCCPISVLKQGLIRTQKVVLTTIIAGGGPEDPVSDAVAAGEEFVGDAIALYNFFVGSDDVVSGPPKIPTAPSSHPSAPSAPAATHTPSTPAAPTASNQAVTPSSPTATPPAKAPQAVQKATGLPAPGKGKGTVAKDDRDPTRTYTEKQKQEMLDRQGGVCAQCGVPKTVKEVDGHHIIRHANGGQTTMENGAAVCKKCHVDLHKQ